VIRTGRIDGFGAFTYQVACVRIISDNRNVLLLSSTALVDCLQPGLPVGRGRRRYPIHKKQTMRRLSLSIITALAMTELVSCGGEGITTTTSPRAPAVTLSASSLTFSNQSVGTASSAKTVTLTDTGTGTLTITGISATGDYVQTNNCGSTLAVSANCIITITFSPTASGSRTGRILVTDNAPRSPQMVSLIGNGVGPVVTLSVSRLTFSSQNVSTTSGEQSVTLTNSGNAQLTVSGVTITGTNSGDFAQSNNCGSIVATGASCSINVTFTPSGGGARAGLISIADDGPGSPQTVTLNGTGVAATLHKLSTDIFTNATSQHATEVEPDTFSFGSTLISVFQAGRFTDGGSSEIGFATSTDGGTTWTSGFLPGITKIQDPANPYDRATDPAVAYDSVHGVWLIATLPLLSSVSGVTGPAVLVSRSIDGVNWDNPITVAIGGDLDKPWITCDNWPTSPFYGNCYFEWDDFGSGDLIGMSTSRDGGLTWGPGLATADRAAGIGGQPVVQPNGTVVVPIADGFEASILVFTSMNGGASWSGTKTVSPIVDHAEAGDLRSGPLPSAEVDAAGKVYVVWQDCRFRSSCASNDIVMTTSTDGVTWTPPARIPIDQPASGVDHFIPGIAVDPATSGSAAHLGITYYFYPQSNCTTSTCQLDVGFISSQDGGTTWSAPGQLAGPMPLSSLPSTDQGRMVGDYISTSYVNGLAHSSFAVAYPEIGTIFDEAIYTTANGLSAPTIGEVFLHAVETPVPNPASDHSPRQMPARVR